VIPHRRCFFFLLTSSFSLPWISNTAPVPFLPMRRVFPYLGLPAVRSLGLVPLSAAVLVLCFSFTARSRKSLLFNWPRLLRRALESLQYLSFTFFSVYIFLSVWTKPLLLSRPESDPFSTPDPLPILDSFHFNHQFTRMPASPFIPQLFPRTLYQQGVSFNKDSLGPRHAKPPSEIFSFVITPPFARWAPALLKAACL